ncbi:MAG: hypothetical protein ACYDD1_22255 [Caulobacteraceae bacterium]
MHGTPQDQDEAELVLMGRKEVGSMVDLSKHVRAVLVGEPIPPLVVDGPVVIEVRKLAVPRVLTAEEAEAAFQPRSITVEVKSERPRQMLAIGKPHSR